MVFSWLLLIRRRKILDLDREDTCKISFFEKVGCPLISKLVWVGDRKEPCELVHIRY